jgi:hypothetical protein
MRDQETLHKKLQEMIDCYATTDPLREMSVIQNEKDVSEASVKWLALAGLHGINMNASEIRIMKSPEGSIKVVAEYRPAELPSPGPAVGDKIIQDIRDITHLEKDTGESMLSLGVREGSIDVKVIVKKEDDGESVVLLFPY